jgi:endonuclease YncB( thermonuclease family)
VRSSRSAVALLATLLVTAGCAPVERPRPNEVRPPPRPTAPQPPVPSVERGAIASGVASVIDGDTIEIHGQRIRLHGIDAPESSQPCDLAGKPWRCGQAAANALAEHIGRRPVTCEPRDRDRYGRLVAACSVGGANISAWMVTEGWAVAYRRYSQDFVADEATARAAKRGIWRSTFVLPWEWRAQRRAGGTVPVARPVSASSPAPQSHRTGCDIKGNINSKGERIYHVPGGRSYANTAIDTARGERWFCSEAEARASGWRPAKQ